MARVHVFVEDVSAMDQLMEMQRLSSLEIFVKLHQNLTDLLEQSQCVT